MTLKIRAARLGDLADRYGGELRGPPALVERARATEIGTLAPVPPLPADGLAVGGSFGLGTLTPFTHGRYLASAALAARRGTTLLLGEELARRPELAGCVVWTHESPTWVLAELLDTVVDAPGDRPAVMGEGTTLGPHVVLYPGVVLGARVRIEAGAVLGSPGFGWTMCPDGRRRHVPQRAGVLVEDDVRIGPNCTIDAGTLSPTRLRSHAKLDAQVHVGHNVDIGERAAIAAQSGFAGSVVVGQDVLVGGQVGVADHIRIGDGAQLAAKSGVIGDVPPGAIVAGYPAVARGRWLRALAKLYRQPRAQPRAMTSLPNVLELADILRILPHRWPFVLVDRVVELAPPERIVAIKAVGGSEPWFAGHFPDRPVFPGVLLLEAMAQAGGILAYASAGDDGSKAAGEQPAAKGAPYLLSADKVKFRRPVLPGDVVELTVTQLHRRGGTFRMRGEARVAGVLVAEAELLAGLVAPSGPGADAES